MYELHIEASAGDYNYTHNWKQRPPIPSIHFDWVHEVSIVTFALIV